MTTDAPVIKEVDIPGTPDRFSKPFEFPIEQPEERPIKVEM